MPSLHFLNLSATVRYHKRVGSDNKMKGMINGTWHIYKICIYLLNLPVSVSTVFSTTFDMFSNSFYMQYAPIPAGARYHMIKNCCARLLSKTRRKKKKQLILELSNWNNFIVTKEKKTSWNSMCGSSGGDKGVGTRVPPPSHSSPGISKYNVNSSYLHLSIDVLCN